MLKKHSKFCHIYFCILLMSLLMVLCSGIIYADQGDILYQEDFEDGDIDTSDPALTNGFTWTAEGDYEITEHWAWLDMGNVVKFDQEGEYIISNEVINASEYTISLDMINSYHTYTRIMFAYIDESNYYYLNPVSGTVYRVLDGISLKISEKRAEGLLTPVYGRSTRTHYKIYFCNSGESITIQIDRDKYDNRIDYGFNYIDNDPTAVSRFNNGKIKLIQPAIGAVYFDNIFVTEGKLITEPPRENRTIYVSQSDGDDEAAGTEEEPFKTIMRALDESMPGDEIIIDDGFYGGKTNQNGRFYEPIKLSPSRAYGLADKRLIIRAKNEHHATIQGASLRYGDYITLKDFDVVEYSISIGGSREVYILNNYVHDVISTGNTARTAISANGYNCRVIGNTITRMNVGIGLGGKNNLIENNDISHVTSNGKADADYMRLFGEGHIIRGNYMHDIYEEEYNGAHVDGFQGFDNGGQIIRHILIENNFIDGTHQALILECGTHYDSYDVTLRNNVFKDCTSAAVLLNGMKDVKVYNNTFINLSQHGFRYNAIGVPPSTGEVYNNIIYNGTRSIFSEGEGCTLNTSNNIIHNTSNNIVYNPESFPDDIVNVDPLFIDPANGDYRLHPNSPAVDNGYILENILIDYDGNPRPIGAGLDIGAFEFQGSDLPMAYINSSNVIDKSSGYQPFKVYFDGSNSYVPEGRNIVSYIWNFDDGITSSGEKVAHTFREDGQHNVTLTITDDEGNSHTASRVFDIIPSEYPNLYLYLPFDGNCQDESGKEMNVEWVKSEEDLDPLYEDTLNGQAARFTEGRAINVTHNDYLDGQEEMSFAFWARKDTADTAATVIYKHQVYGVNLTSDGFKAVIYNKEYQKCSVAASNILGDTKWHHYAVTYDGSNIDLYLDGYKCSSVEFSGTVRRESSRDIMIGKYNWGHSLEGLMDDVRIYDKALTEDEINNIINNSRPAETDPVILQEPESLTAVEGSDVTFSVAVNAEPEPTYQWKHNGQIISRENASGEATDTLTLTNVQRSDEGNYQVVVSNDIGSVESRIVTLEVVAFPPPIESIDCTPEYYTTYLSWKNPDNQDDWDRVIVLRKEASDPEGYDHGEEIYNGTGNFLSDRILNGGYYYYEAYTYKEYPTNKVYSELAKSEVVGLPETYGKQYVKVESNEELQNIKIGQNTRGDLYSLWSVDSYTLGIGPGGNQTDLWVYSDLIGNDPGQIPEDSEIVSARFVFKVADNSFVSSNSSDNSNDNNNSTDINQSHKVNIYRITDPDSLGSPHYAEESGIRVGLDFYYRDHRPGINIPGVDSYE
ncbi:MAG: LamG-like jellyroll fold domain-containing protein, partial [Halanaerobiales bacterium]